jgi:UV DNA damage endonuclease
VRAAPGVAKVSGMEPRVRLGYVAICRSLDLGASHTTRLALATPERLATLVAENLEELARILAFNEAHGIHLFRIGSSLVPLASHPVNRLRWWKTFARDFAALGRLAARSGQRLSLHPSPAGASLSGLSAATREAARRELRYGARVLDLLGQGPEGRVVVHVGGAAPDRAVALARAHRFLDSLDGEIRRRLAVEHDDRIWRAREVLPLAREHGLPFVADNLHHQVLPSEPPLSLAELFAAAAPTWAALGLRPKAHLASQRAGAKPGAHADRVDPAVAARVLAALPGPYDLMLEAKEKDLALFDLRRQLPGIEGDAPRAPATPPPGSAPGAAARKGRRSAAPSSPPR